MRLLKTTTLGLLMGLLATSLLTSCDDADTAPPTVTVNSPSTGMVNAGENLGLDITFEDETGLGELLVEIHSAADGHSHKTTDADHWNWMKTVNAEGAKSYTWNETLQIPAGDSILGGPYHLIIDANDQEGNSVNGNSVMEVELMIDNGSLPSVSEFTIDGGSPSGEHHMHFDGGAAQVSAQISAVVSDADLLEEALFVFYGKEEDHGDGHDHGHDHDHDHNKRSEEDHGHWVELMRSAEITDIAGSDTDTLNYTLTLQNDMSGLHNGDNLLRLVVTDSKGNVAHYNQAIHVMGLN